MTPTGEEDFGTVICTSYNEIGRQIEPCLFDLIPVGRNELFSVSLCAESHWLQSILTSLSWISVCSIKVMFSYKGDGLFLETDLTEVEY